MKPVFQTRLDAFDYITVWAQVFLFLGAVFFFGNDMTRTSWGGQLTMIVFFLFFLVQGIRSAKVFILYPDRLVVKRPFTFTSKTDVIFEVSILTEVIFRNVSGRFGGPHIIIKGKLPRKSYSVTVEESYRIDVSDSLLQEFISCLSGLGVKTTNENELA